MLVVITYVSPRCDETYFSRARPICASFCDGYGCRHSCSKSWSRNTISNHTKNLRDHLGARGGDSKVPMGVCTSISKSSSILTIFPKRKIYCIRLANSHIFLKFFNVSACSGTCSGSVGRSSEASAAERLQRGIVEERVNQAGGMNEVGRVIERDPLESKNISQSRVKS